MSARSESLIIAGTGRSLDPDTDLASAEVLSGDDIIVGHNGRARRWHRSP